jgi:hypothetical protein
MATEHEYIDLEELDKNFVSTFDGIFFKLNASTNKELVEDFKFQSKVLADKIRQVKISANKQRIEDVANEMLGKEAALRSLYLLCEMWLSIFSNPHKAWVYYVDAEEWGELAVKFFRNPRLVTLYTNYFKSIELLLFPQMVFFSAGFNRTPGKCTICELPMKECEHIEGRIYFGQVCDEFGWKIIEADHVAFVDHPRDRRCFSHAYKSDGQWIDRVTRAKIERPGKPDEEDGFLVEGTILTAHTPAGVFL